MTCASCVGRVEAALAKVRAWQRVRQSGHRAGGHPPGSPVDRMALIQAVEKVGYDVPAGTIELAVEA
jgi:Au+-exporting ATPase